MNLNIPNLISLLRLFLVPVIIWLLLGEQYNFALLCFVIAGISDMLDGFIARWLKCQTTLGEYLDPLADKVLLVAVFVTLGIQGVIPSWLVILVVFRDFIILGGALLSFIFSMKAKLTPVFISKINTALQISLVVLLLAELTYYDVYIKISDTIFNDIMFIIVAVTTLLSGGSYVTRWLSDTSSGDTNGK